jgi:type IV pilus assembly protein PilP
MSTVHLPNVMRTLLLAATLAFIAGCTGGDSDLKEWVAAEKAKKGAPIPPLPVLKTFETFEYKVKDKDDNDRRDPFGPSVQEKLEAQATSGSGPQPDKHPKEPLENYPLDALKMVGSIGTGPTMEGLIRDPDSVIHRVHVNNYLGENGGKITAIAEDHIDLVELIPNETGGWRERKATIAPGEK